MALLAEMVRSFRAMNTDVELILCVSGQYQVIGQRALERAQHTFETVEKTLSRFEPESELSRLNVSGGSLFKASLLLFQVVKASLEAARVTGGIFDPTVLPDLLAAGYDRSFEKLPRCSDIPRPDIPQTKCNWRDIRLDSESSSISMPEGCAIDLGGIGKGWAVDRAADSLEQFTNYAVDAGGDIRVNGSQANGLPWTIGIADPFIEGHDVTVIELGCGGVCTSTTARRKWESAGKWQHHVIDPRSGEPSQSGVVSATVIADSAATAEVITKASIILGPEDGMKFIESQPGAQGLLVLNDRRLLRSSGFNEPQYVA